jgi:cleavage and polyadenylation specificity factor subunit 5
VSLRIYLIIILIFIFVSPGDYLKPGEDEIEGLKARLDERLAPTYNNNTSSHEDWQIGECLSVWIRPNFETFMVFNLQGNLLLS